MSFCENEKRHDDKTLILSKKRSEKVNGLGGILKIIRTANNLSINELATCLNLSASYISAVETSTRKATLSLVERYSNFFNIKKSTILYFAENDDANEYQKILFKILNEMMNN